MAGGADLAIRLESLDGDLNFTGLEYWPAGAAPGPVGTGSMWQNGDLGYRVEVRGNTFVQNGGDVGAVTGTFFGPAHEGMGGVIVREDLSAGFGGTHAQLWHLFCYLADSDFVNRGLPRAAIRGREGRVEGRSADVGRIALAENPGGVKRSETASSPPS